MAQRKTERLTPLELEIEKVLWETGFANVQTVQQRLNGNWPTPRCRPCSTSCIAKEGQTRAERPRPISTGRLLAAARSSNMCSQRPG